MKILVTGASGGIGNAVAARLARHGHEVRGVDIKPPSAPAEGVEYAVCDITNYEQVREQTRGMEGVAHLAAYADPFLAPGPEIFRVNCWGTYNVFEAAAKEGIRRVAQASSINALGNPYGVFEVPLHYFPIDEDHPTFTTDPYSFSKETVESIAEYYWRREGITSTSLRMPFVVAFDERFEWMAKEAMNYRRALDELLSASEDRQSEWVAKIRAGTAKMRAERAFEKPWTGEMEEAFDPDLMVGFGFTEFWTILAMEDAAQAFEKSLLADYEGSHPLYVCQRENMSGVESEKLLKLFYPDVSGRRRPIAGVESIVSWERARELIGFEPEILVRDRL